MTGEADRAIRRFKSQTTLADVFLGLEPGDRLEYSNQFGQTFVGTVANLIGTGTIVITRPEWQALGFGPEVLSGADYWLESVLRPGA